MPTIDIAILMFLIAVLLASCTKDKGKFPAEVPIQETTVTPPAVQTEPTSTNHPNNSLKEGLEIGDLAYDLNLQDSNGVFIKLSSLRGNLVLLDFWASWCAPCKSENRKLKDIYGRYSDTVFAKAKGFQVYMVSIWDKKEPWLKRLQIEQYNWQYDLFDEGGAAEWRYGVRSIPMNFLIDSSGIIIAKNLRDSLVEKTLIQQLK